MNKAGNGIVSARSDPSQPVFNDRCAPRYFDDHIGRVGVDRIVSGRQDGDAPKSGHRQEAGRLTIHNEHVFPAGSLQQRAAVEPEQPRPLDHGPFSTGRKGFDDGDHGGQGAIGRCHHGIGQRVGHRHQVCAGSQHQMGRVASIQSRALRQTSVTIFEEALAFLREIPASAGLAQAAGVGEGPGDALVHPRCIHARSNGDHSSDRLVTQHQGRRPTASSPIGVEVGSAEGGQGDGHQCLSRSKSGTRESLIPERGFSTGENGGQNAGFHRFIDTEGLGRSRGISHR